MITRNDGAKRWIDYRRRRGIWKLMHLKWHGPKMPDVGPRQPTRTAVPNSGRGSLFRHEICGARYGCTVPYKDLFEAESMKHVACILCNHDMLGEVENDDGTWAVRELEVKSKDLEINRLGRAARLFA